MKSGVRLRFLDNHTCKEIVFTSPPRFCDFEYQKDRYVTKPFIRKGLKDFYKDIQTLKKIYDTPIDICDPYFHHIDNFPSRFTKFAYLRKEFSEGVPMDRPIFYGTDSDFLIGSGRCLIIGTYFKDMKIDMVRVCEKEFIESTKKVYDFIRSFNNESEDVLLHIEKSDFIDAYKIVDITFGKLEDCITRSGGVLDFWHEQPDFQMLRRKVRKIIQSTNIDNVDQLYDVLDEISLLSIQ